MNSRRLQSSTGGVSANMIIPENDEVDSVAEEIMTHLFNEELKRQNRESMLQIDESAFEDEQMLQYNFRPMAYTLSSIIIISLPIMLNEMNRCCSITSVQWRTPYPRSLLYHFP